MKFILWVTASALIALGLVGLDAWNVSSTQRVDEVKQLIESLPAQKDDKPLNWHPFCPRWGACRTV